MEKGTPSTSLRAPGHPQIGEARRRSSQEALWQRYLRDLEQPAGSLTTRAAQGLRKLWRLLRSTIGGRFPLPRAVPTEDHGIILSWEKANHYLEVEIFDHGRHDWFYREERSGKYVGGEDRRSDLLDPELERYAKLLS